MPRPVKVFKTSVTETVWIPDGSGVCIKLLIKLVTGASGSSFTFWPDHGTCGPLGSATLQFPLLSHVMGSMTVGKVNPCGEYKAAIS